MLNALWGTCWSAPTIYISMPGYANAISFRWSCPQGIAGCFFWLLFLSIVLQVVCRVLLIRCDSILLYWFRFLLQDKQTNKQTDRYSFTSFCSNCYLFRWNTNLDWFGIWIEYKMQNVPRFIPCPTLPSQAMSWSLWRPPYHQHWETMPILERASVSMETQRAQIREQVMVQMLISATQMMNQCPGLPSIMAQQSTSRGLIFSTDVQTTGRELEIFLSAFRTRFLLLAARCFLVASFLAIFLVLPQMGNK